VDAAGQRHDFHFRVHLLGDRVALDAFELRDGEPHGYNFQIIGDPQGDLFALMGQLVERMRRALALRHLEYGSNCPLNTTKITTLVGMRRSSKSYILYSSTTPCAGSKAVVWTGGSWCRSSPVSWI